jgi:hypothetical protein
VRLRGFAVMLDFACLNPDRCNLFLCRVNPVEFAAVIEMYFLRLFPASNNLVVSKQFDRQERSRIFLRN